MDIRAYLFEPLLGASFIADLTAAESGLLSGMELALIRGAELGFQLESVASDGMRLDPGSRVLRLIGSAEEVARGEEDLLACVGKASGVATASARLLGQAAGRVRVVCGAWKKVTPELRKWLRQAIAVGGVGIRLIEEPFVYLDKNYVRMFGSIREIVERARQVDGRTVVVQIRGDTDVITKEAGEAFRAGAEVLMVDTGKIADLLSVVAAASSEGFREDVRIAFAGGVTGLTLDDVIAAGADIVDVGRSVIDAPLLDFRFDVLNRV